MKNRRANSLGLEHLSFVLAIILAGKLQ